MNSRDFCFWLQGFFEMRGADTHGTAIDPRQVDLIERHLHLVFQHDIDPSIDDGDGKKKSQLNAIHAGKSPVVRC